MIEAGDGHWIYVEEVGTRGATPVIFLHGGPGSGSQHYHRLLFDLQQHHAFLFDQRGAGRSYPYLSLEANTTHHLVADIELIRTHFGIERWFVVGGSWGSTLALAYAEAYPERVAGLVLRAVFFGTDQEIEWAFLRGPQIFRPELYADWVSYLEEFERKDPLGAYLERLNHPELAIKTEAARVWNAYERALSELTPNEMRIPANIRNDARVPPTPIIEAHYIRNKFFLAEGQLIRDVARIRNIPGAIVQGRYDLLCPPAAAQALADAWPAAKLTFVNNAGHVMSEPGIFEAMREAVARITR